MAFASTAAFLKLWDCIDTLSLKAKAPHRLERHRFIFNPTVVFSLFIIRQLWASVKDKVIYKLRWSVYDKQSIDTGGKLTKLMCINSICDFLVGQANGLLNNKRIIILHITLGVVSSLFVFQLIACENIDVQQEITKSTTTTLKDVYCQCGGRNNTCEKWLMIKISTEKINKTVGFSSWHWKNGERKMVHIIYKMWHEVLAQHFIRAPVFVYHIVNASYYFNFLKFHNVAL